MKHLLFLIVAALSVPSAHAQLVEPNQVGVRMGHVHLAVKDVDAPDIKTEPTENPNEVYFFPIDIPASKAWYVKAFGANPGRRPCVACLSNPRMIEADDLPGVNLSFSPGTMPPLPTKGRSVDHIGFEVENLEAFVSSLEAKGIMADAPDRATMWERELHA